MDWRDTIAGVVTTVLVGALEELIRRNMKGGAGVLLGNAAAVALWPLVRNEVRRQLDGLVPELVEG
jgi:hypothetical protein